MTDQLPQPEIIQPDLQTQPAELNQQSPNIPMSGNAEEFLPTFSKTRQFRKYLSTPPTFVPKSFIEQIQFYDDGTHRRIYFYANQTWNYVPVSNFPVIDGGTGASSLSAHGVVIGQGQDPVHVSGAGSSGQVLTSNGASSDPTFQNLPPSSILIGSGAGGSCVNTSSETDLINVTVPADTLGTTGAIIGRAYFRLSATAGNSPNIQLTLRFGTFANIPLSWSIGNTNFIVNGYIDFLIVNTGATNSQSLSYQITAVGNPASYQEYSGNPQHTTQFGGTAEGGGTEDTTTNEVIRFTAQWTANAHANNTCSISHFVIYKIT